MRTPVNPFKIAVLDHDETLLSLLDEVLTEEGYLVRPFTELVDAQRSLYEEKVEVAMVDLRTGGREFLEY